MEGSITTFVFLVGIWTGASCLKITEIERSVMQISDLSYICSISVHYVAQENDTMTLAVSETELLLQQAEEENSEYWNTWIREEQAEDGSFIGELNFKIQNITLESNEYFDTRFRRTIIFNEILRYPEEGQPQIANLYFVDLEFVRHAGEVLDGPMESILYRRDLGSGPYWLETPLDQYYFQEGSRQVFQWKYFSVEKPSFTLFLTLLEDDVTVPTSQIQYNPDEAPYHLFPYAHIDHNFEETDDGIITTVMVVVDQMKASQYRGALSIHISGSYMNRNFISSYSSNHYVVLHPEDEDSFYNPGELFVKAEGPNSTEIGDVFKFKCTGYGYGAARVFIKQWNQLITPELMKERGGVVVRNDILAGLDQRSIEMTLLRFELEDAGKYKCFVQGYGGYRMEYIEVKPLRKIGGSFLPVFFADHAAVLKCIIEDEEPMNGQITFQRESVDHNRKWSSTEGPEDITDDQWTQVTVEFKGEHRIEALLHINRPMSEIENNAYNCAYKDFSGPVNIEANIQYRVQ